MILPALIFLVAGPISYLMKGLARKVFLVLVPLVVLVEVAMVRPGTTGWSTQFLNVRLILFKADKLSLIVAYIFLIIAALGALYTSYSDDKRLHLFAYLYIGGALGVVFSGDFFSLYGFWELMALASTALIFLRDDENARTVGSRYLVMHIIGGAILLAGILLHFGATGSIAVGSVKEGLPAVLIMLGVGLNCAFVLIHTWLPDAYPTAPFWASVFMSVYTTKTAVYVLARTSSGWLFVAYVGALMAVFGATFALMQSRGRKLLSYHIVSQVGYMVAAIGLGGALGINGGIFHLVNHILYKSLLFMCIGAVIYRTGEEDLTKLGGLTRKMPWTTLCAVIASLSIAGAPLFNGFGSKAIIFEAAHSYDAIYLLLELAAVGTFLSFFKFTYFGFLRPNKKIEATEVPVGMLAPMLIVAFMNVAIGVYPALVTRFLPFPVEGPIYTVEGVVGKIQIIFFVSLVFFFGLKYFAPHKRVIRDFDRLYFIGARAVVAFLEQGASIDLAINNVYYQIAKLPAWISRGADRVNNGFEAATGKIIPAIMSLKPAVYKLNELGARLLFAVFVDMWLFKPITQAVTKLKADEAAKAKKSTHVVEDLARLGERTSFWVGKVDIKIIDRLIDQFAKLGERISQFTGLFDSRVVDGIVNGVGTLTQKAGKSLRPFQTGDVQTYGLVMIGGAFFALLFFALVFYGVLSVS